MKTEKLNLKGIKNVLSRGEMKKIMAGSGGAACCLCLDGPKGVFGYEYDPNNIPCGTFCSNLSYVGTSGNVALSFCGH